MAGPTRSQKITRETLEKGVCVVKTSPQLLHRTLLGRLAFRNTTARSPPAKNTGQLNEPRSSIAGLKSSGLPHDGQGTFGTDCRMVVEVSSDDSGVPQPAHSVSTESLSRPQ